MLNEIQKRVVDPQKTIAEVDGAGQAGNMLRIRWLNEKLWATDALFIGGLLFMPVNDYEPSKGSIEIEIHPAIIPNGMYRNVCRSPHNGEAIRRSPYAAAE